MNTRSRSFTSKSILAANPMPVTDRFTRSTSMRWFTRGNCTIAVPATDMRWFARTWRRSHSAPIDTMHR